MSPRTSQVHVQAKVMLIDHPCRGMRRESIVYGTILLDYFPRIFAERNLDILKRMGLINEIKKHRTIFPIATVNVALSD